MFSKLSILKHLKKNLKEKVKIRNEDMTKNFEFNLNELIYFNSDEKMHTSIDLTGLTHEITELLYDSAIGFQHFLNYKGNTQRSEA